MLSQYQKVYSIDRGWHRKWIARGFWCIGGGMVLFIGCMLSGAFLEDPWGVVLASLFFPVVGLFFLVYAWFVAPEELIVNAHGLTQRLRIGKHEMKWSEVRTVRFSRKQMTLRYGFMPVISEEAIRVSIISESGAKIRLTEAYAKIQTVLDEVVRFRSANPPTTIGWSIPSQSVATDIGDLSSPYAGRNLRNIGFTVGKFLSRPKQDLRKRLFIAACVAVFMYFIWPTPYIIGRSGGRGQLQRVNRFSGVVEYASARGWVIRQ